MEASEWVEKIEIFDHTLLRFRVPSNLYQSKSLRKDIDDLFTSSLVLSKGLFCIEQTGISYSTCPIADNSLVTNLSDIFPLISYITQLITTHFYKEPNKHIFYLRMWINKIFKGCSGKCHIHSDPFVDGVAVFYFNVPENGSDLIILKNEIDGEVTKIHQNISHHIKVKTGDLIIHKNDVPHSVSKHMSIDPRICFVFEFGENSGGHLSD